MKRWLFLMALLMISSTAGAQVYTDDGVIAPAPLPPASRYRLRNAYPVYPGYPVGPNTSPDTAVVGQPYYYPYGYPAGTYGYPGVSTDGDSAFVPGR